MIKLDARGLSCPEPLMMVQQAMKQSNEPIEIIVSEVHTKRNIEMFAKEQGKEVTAVTQGFDIVLTIK
ncbi:sulfurtransferase TusA family protein [Guggenheimella bovis]